MAPIKILCTQDNRLLVSSMSQNSQMNRNVELNHFAGIKLDVSWLTFKFKEEGLIKFKFTTSSYFFCVVPISHETNWETHILIVSRIYKIYKCSSINDLALNMSFVWVELFQSTGSSRLTCSTAAKTVRLWNINSSCKWILSGILISCALRNLYVVKHVAKNTLTFHLFYNLTFIHIRKVRILAQGSLKMFYQFHLVNLVLNQCFGLFVLGPWKIRILLLPFHI